MKQRVVLIVELILATGICSSQPPWQGGSIKAISRPPVTGYDGSEAAYGRIVQSSTTTSTGVSQEVLLTFYLDAQGPDVWTCDGQRQKAKDVFVTRSENRGVHWTSPLNLSNSASRSSIQADGDSSEVVEQQPYVGDSFRLRVLATGSWVLVSWLDRYCPGGQQGLARYHEPLQIEVPFACVWTARSVDGGENWFPPEQLTLGQADANQISASSSDAGFALVWQEDPNGLQPGEAEGPGDGGSGARTSSGTEVWYSALRKSELGEGKSFPPPIPISNNSSNSTHVPLSEEEVHEGGGSMAASRPQIMLFGATAVVAYEETKGISVTESGKYILYHVFSAFDKSLPDATGGTGWILSSPSENARRVRLVRPSGGSSGNLRLFVFWRQGATAVSGPADIVGRLGRASTPGGLNGLIPGDLQPSLHPGAMSPQNAALSSPPLNLSSSAGLSSSTSANPIENARAHRAIIKGNFVALGYLRTENQAAAEGLSDTYDFLVRRSFDGGLSWDNPVNLTQIKDPSLEAFEPRLITTPASTSGVLRNDLVLFVAWALRDKSEEGKPAGIFFRRSTDQGQTYEDTHPFKRTTPAGAEVQMRCPSDGSQLFAVWRETDQAGTSNIVFRQMSAPFPLLDIDGNGVTDALTDGLLMVRYLFGLRGQALLQDALGANALRRDEATIVHYLDASRPFLDVEADGGQDALSDGLLLLRYLFGFRGETLIRDALKGGGTRHSIADIERFLSEVL